MILSLIRQARRWSFRYLHTSGYHATFFSITFLLNLVALLYCLTSFLLEVCCLCPIILLLGYPIDWQEQWDGLCSELSYYSPSPSLWGLWECLRCTITSIWMR